MNFALKIILAIGSIAVSIYVGLQVHAVALQRAATGGPPPKVQLVAVETMSPRQQTVEDRADLVGVLESGAQVQLVARTSGYITELPFNVGDLVRAGEIVVRIDDSRQRETVTSSNAALTIAEAQQRAKQAEVNLAQKIVDRERLLFKTKANTAQDLEAAEGQLLVAQAQLELEEARVSQALSQLEQSQLLLREMQILAPTSGIVAERFVDVGDLAKNDVPLMRLVQIDTVRTFVNVVEANYSKITVGQTAAIETDAFPDRTFQGRVIRKAPVIDPTTGTATVQIEIPNEKHLLKPGMHARASILFQRREHVTVIPAAALLETRRFPAVMVVRGDPATTELREVEIGKNDGEVVEVLAGIEADDRVVTIGSRIVDDGQTVNPHHVEWPVELLATEADTYPIAAE